MSGRGAGWEAIAGELLDRLQDRGMLSWHRLHPEVTQLGPIRAGGRFEAMRTAKGPPDALILRAGRAILAEFKETRASAWHLSAVPPHQANALDRAIKQGCAGAVLLRVVHGVEAPPRLWALSWGLLSRRYRAHAEGVEAGTVPLADLPRLGMQFYDVGSLLEALDAVGAA